MASKVDMYKFILFLISYNVIARNSNEFGSLLNQGISTKNTIHKRSLEGPKTWPSQPIYYTFRIGDFTPAQKKMIEDVLRNEFTAKTTILFEAAYRPRSPFICFQSFNLSSRFEGHRGFSSLGFQGYDIASKGQNINLNNDCCTFKGEIILHVARTLGLPYEMQRPDRDQYVDVFDEFISPETYEDSFEILNWTPPGVPYDYGSVMQMSGEDGGIDTVRAMLPKDKRFTRSMGQRSELSFYDAHTLYKLYSDERVTCQNGGYLQETTFRCACPDGFTGVYCETLLQTSTHCLHNGGPVIRLNQSIPSGFLSYPRPDRYPDPYSYGDQCSWLLQAPKGFKLTAWFDEDFLLPSTGIGFSPCLHWVEIKHQGKAAVRGPRYCGKINNLNVTGSLSFLAEIDPPTALNPITSDGTELMVIFRALDYRTRMPMFYADTGYKFKLYYRIVSDESELAEAAKQAETTSTNLAVSLTIGGLTILTILLLAVMLWRKKQATALRRHTNSCHVNSVSTNEYIRTVASNECIMMGPFARASSIDKPKSLTTYVYGNPTANQYGRNESSENRLPEIDGTPPPAYEDGCPPSYEEAQEMMILQNQANHARS